MKTLWITLAVCTLGGIALAQPSIQAENGVVNAFSELPDIARGSWFVVKGAAMGPANIAVYTGGLPHPENLSGTQVTFTPAAGGTAINARMYYTLALKVAALLPSSTPAGAYDVRVIYNGTASAPRRVQVVERNFGYATQSSNGQGPAQATYGGLDLNRFTTGTIAQWSTRPARGNDSMILWGTGLVADASSDTQGGVATGDQTAAAQVRVIVDGTEVTPAYAGRSSGSPGLDQINFTVPGNVRPGCFVSIQVRAGGRLSNLGSIAVSESGRSACTHPSYTETQLSSLDRGGSLVIGSLGLSKSSTKFSAPGLGTFTSDSEGASGYFARYTIDTLGSAPTSLIEIGACYVIRQTQTTTVGQVTPPTPLDAGAQLTLNGPNAANKAIPTVANTKTYNANLYTSGFMGFGGSGSPTLVQGSYTISGTGGADVGAFSATISLPGAFTWTNQDTIADPIPRGSGLNITWSGGTTGLVTMVGYGARQTGGTQQNPIYDSTIFYCTAQATAGSFTIPSSVLQQVPVVTSDPTSGSFGNLSVYVTPDSAAGQGAFSAPLTAGGRTDFAYFTYLIGSSKGTGFN